MGAPILAAEYRRSRFLIVAPAGNEVAGVSFVITVTALNPNGTTNTGYSGTVAFTSSDGSATFTPTTITLTSGVGTDTVTLTLAGTQTVTARGNDTASTGGSVGVTVSPGAANHLAFLNQP